jgi:ATP-dependent DNA ligase
VGSLLLGLYNSDGKLDHVGFTFDHRQQGPRRSDRAARSLGRGQSRWSTERSGEWQSVMPKLVVEVSFDQVTGDRLRHGTKLVRWRPDKNPRRCTLDQSEKPAKPTGLVAGMLKP